MGPQHTKTGRKPCVILTLGTSLNPNLTYINWQDKMAFAKNESVRVASEISTRCSSEQRDYQDAVEAWELRCHREGIVWDGVAAGAAHTCALAKDSADSTSGAMCCWGAMGRYDAYGRMDILKKQESYAYLGLEGMTVDPAHVLSKMHDATPDNVDCAALDPDRRGVYPSYSL